MDEKNKIEREISHSGDMETTKKTYEKQLEDNFLTIIQGLELTEVQKKYLEKRWLDQVLWMEGKAAGSQKPYYLLRVFTIVGGVIVPALVGLNIDNSAFLTTIIIILSLVVASSAALEGFFKYGERWQHYRGTVEVLKSEGWHFLGFTGDYKNNKTHGEAFQHFSETVEQLIRSDVESFIAKIAREAEKGKK